MGISAETATREYVVSAVVWYQAIGFCQPIHAATARQVTRHLALFANVPLALDAGGLF